MEPTTTQNPNEANLDDLQLRAKSQYLYVVGAAVIVAVAGIALMVILWDRIGIQNTLLIGAATIFGIVILSISAADTMAKDRGFRRHRDEQEIMDKLAEKYRKKSEQSSGESSGESGSSASKASRTRG